MPFISVIISVYQKEKYLNKLFESIRNQSFDDFETIFIDDGSTDNSPKMIDSFVKESNKHRVVHQKNSGVCAARNKGIELANGKYIYIIDADDWLSEDALLVLSNEAKKTNADVIYADVFIEGLQSKVEKPFSCPFNTNSKKTINVIQCALNNNNKIFVNCDEFNTINYLGGAPWRAMLKKSIVTMHHIEYNHRLKNLGEDILFWQNIFEYVKSVSYVDSPIYHYRNMENSLSHGYKPDLLSIYYKSFREQRLFLIKNNKGKEHWEAFYFRVILYINQSMIYYYLNKHNTNSILVRYISFRAMLKKKPFCIAIKTVPLKMLVSKKKRFLIALLRCHCYLLYWILFCVKERTGNS